MKKLLSLLVIMAVMAMVMSAQAIERRITDYAMSGLVDSNVVITAIDSSSTVKTKVLNAIDTMSQFAYRPLVTPLTFSTTARDTIFHTVFVVPTGKTVTIRGCNAIAHVAPTATADDSIFLFLRMYDYSAGAGKKVATNIRLGDSSGVSVPLLVSDSLEALTIDSVTSLAAGDVLYACTWADTTAVTSEAFALIWDIDIDE